MDFLEAFQFETRLSLSDASKREKMLLIFQMELALLQESSRHVSKVVVMPEGESCIKIVIHGTGSTGYKIATTAVQKYLDIIGKSLQLIDAPGEREG